MLVELDAQGERGKKLLDIVEKMPLMDSVTLPHLVTISNDFKHQCKRVRGMLISTTRGFMVGQHTFYAEDLRRFLEALPEPMQVKQNRMDALFNPSDRQNVPLAVHLLQLVSRLRNLAESQLTRQQDQRYLPEMRLLGHICYHFLEPYISVQCSLAEQLRHLAAAAHLLFTIQRQVHTKFLPNQLYTDMQLTIQSAFMSVAKAHIFIGESILDANYEFFLVLEGSDGLEGVFACVRTQHHDRNMNLLEFCDRAGTAIDLSAVYDKHPDWCRTPVRLQMRGDSGVDHIRPRHITGDVKVATVFGQLPTLWQSGRSHAIAALIQVEPYINLTSEWFDHLPRSDPGGYVFSMLKPEGAYVGVDTLDEEDYVFSSSAPADGALDSGQSSETGDSVIEMLSEAAEVETASTPDLQPSLVCTNSSFAPTVMVEGKQVYKATLLNCLLSKEGLGPSLSTDRLRRVMMGGRGYFKGDGAPTFAPLEGEMQLYTNDPFATLVRTSTGMVALAVVLAGQTGIARKSSTVEVITTVALKEFDTKVPFSTLLVLRRVRP